MIWHLNTLQNDHHNKTRMWEEETTEDETVGWHPRLDGHEFWVSSGSWWWTGKPGVLQSVGLQRGRHDWVTELKDIDNSVWCTFLRCFADTIIATKGKNLTVWWSDCSHDISCCIFFFPSIVNLQHLQYSDDLCYTVKWLSYTHIYIFLSIYFSIMVYYRLLNIVQ